MAKGKRSAATHTHLRDELVAAKRSVVALERELSSREAELVSLRAIKANYDAGLMPELAAERARGDAATEMVNEAVMREAERWRATIEVVRPVIRRLFDAATKHKVGLFEQSKFEEQSAAMSEMFGDDFGRGVGLTSRDQRRNTLTSGATRAAIARSRQVDSYGKGKSLTPPRPKAAVEKELAERVALSAANGQGGL